MGDFVFNRPTEADMIYLAENLRPEDRREVAGMTGPDFLRTIRRAVETSECCWSCNKGEKVMAIFGVIRTNPYLKHGVIWMLASNETAKHKMYVGRMTRKGINALLDDWEYLYNYVDEGNDSTIEWLKWMGAEVHPARPMGIYGLKYHLFTFKRR